MRKLGIVFLLLAAMLAPLAPTAAFARGGQAADDCPPGSKDPDCAKG